MSSFPSGDRKTTMRRRNSDSLLISEKERRSIAASTLSLPEQEELELNDSHAPEEKKNPWKLRGMRKQMSKTFSIPASMTSKASSSGQTPIHEQLHPRPFEKEKLLETLEQFFSVDGNDYRYDSLFDDYEWAVESDCLPSYDQLLKNLYDSSLRFDEFAVVYSDNGQGDTLCVEFSDQKDNFDDSVDQHTATTTTVDESDIDKLVSQVHSTQSPGSKKPIETEVAEMRKDMIVYKSMVQYNHRELQDKYQDLYAKYNANTKRVLDHYSSFREDIIALKSEVHRKTDLVDVDIMSLPEDAFSFLMYRPFGLPAIAALLVFVLQMTTYFLAVSNNFILERESDFARIPFLDIPLGVTNVVHAGQGIAIALIFLVNDGLWESSLQLLNGYNKDLEEHQIAYHQWFVSNLLRFTEGVGASIVLFFLIVQSDNIVELFKDFTAMTFISSLDNVVYQLAEMNVIGIRMKEATEICEIEVHTRKLEKSEEDEVRKIMHFLRHPATINGLWFCAIYIMWITVGVIPQINGDYLCQSIFIQLDDHVNPKLSYFSGIYNLQKGSQKKSLFTTSYIEVKSSLEVESAERPPLILRFCRASQNWIFTFSDKNKDECDGFRFIESTAMNDQQQYDLFNVPSDSWLVNNAHNATDGSENPRFIPLSIIFTKCIDRDESILNISTGTCPQIEIDVREQFGPFIGTRSWSSEFHRMNITKGDNSVDVQVYNRPVYYNERNDLNEIEMVLFTGKRWMITSSRFIYEAINYKPNDERIPIDISNDQTGRSDLEKLGNKIQREFHAYHSRYYAAFFSEAVNFDTPEDSGLPTGLKWYSATSDENPEADLKRDVTSLFICSECDDETNKCFYENKCNNKKCECGNGSHGTLCQILPSSDGRCNPYFNEQTYDFDGGDCCIHSCKSKGDNICGRDTEADFYTGYDLCKNENSPQGRVSFQDVNPSNGDIYQVSQVSLSSNGRIMASIDSRTLSVRVYDNDGASWRMRGTAVATVNDLLTDSVEISSYVGFVNTLRSSLSPVTVAVKSDGRLRIFDWIVNTWVDHSPDVLHNSTVGVKEALLRNDGKTFGVLLTNGTFSILHRSSNDAKWYIRDSVKGKGGDEKYTFAALSYDGKRYLLANDKVFHVYHEKERHDIDFLRPKDKIKAVAMSTNGDHIALLIEYQPKKGQVSLFDFQNSDLKKTHISLRGLDASGITVSLFDDGVNLALHSDIEKKLLFYSIVEEDGNKKWDTPYALEGRVQRVTFSTNQKVLAVIPESNGNMGDSVSSLKVYNIIGDCSPGYSNAHVTFNLDTSQRSLSWEIRHMISRKNDTILVEGGPYELGQIAVTDNFCLRTEFVPPKNNEGVYNPPDGCIYIKIRDLELDGLRSPGRIGVTVNGTVYFNATVTDGYQDFFTIFGDRNCLDTLKKGSPWGARKFDTSLQTVCRTEECEWVSSGNTLKSFAGFFRFSDYGCEIPQPLSMSSDGSVIAFSELENNTFGNVAILEFEEQTWNMLGSSIKGNSEDKFGFSKSLSADGGTVAIGSPTSNTNGFKSGHVSIYYYDGIESEWYPKGNVVNGTEHTQLGWSVTLSADGSIVAIGTGSSDPKCHAYVYAFDETTEDWIQKGDCLDALLGYEAYFPETFLFNNYPAVLSSNGRVVAIGAPLSNYAGIGSGQVVVYEFNDVLGKWTQRGKLIPSVTAFNLVGASISLSANGNIMAVGSLVNFDVLVYQYSSINDEWERFGSKIETQGAEIGTVQVSLTSNGLGLTISTMWNFFTYVYDETTFVWIKNFIGTRDLNNTSFSPFSISADGMTIAVATTEQNDVNVWKLKSFETDSTCTDKQDSFNFTITPDKFPKDLAWVFYNSKGTVIIGGFIPETQQRTPTYVYDQCLQKGNEIYTFSLYDFYGDGICCEWGIGNYSLTFNSEIVSTSENFTNNRFICLADEDIEVLDIRIKQSTDTALFWNLFDMESKLADETTVINPFVYGICQKRTLCYTFAISNPSQGSLHSIIRFGDEQKILNTTNMAMGAVMIGNCTGENTLTCSNGNTMLTLDFFTDNYAQELYWAVLDANRTVVMSSIGKQLLSSTYHHFPYCLSEEIHPCPTVVIMDSYGDDGAAYRVLWKNQFFVNKTRTSIEKLYLGNTTECSRQITCDDGYAVFEIEFKGTTTATESWFEVRNEQDVTFARGEAVIYNGDYRSQQTCLPLPRSSTDPNKCWTFVRVTDTDYTVEVYQITWNGEVIRKLVDGGFEAPFYEPNKKPFSFGDC